MYVLIVRDNVIALAQDNEDYIRTCQNKLTNNSCMHVMRQKYKPLQPTLRVATDFDSVEVARAELKAEEWRQRVINDK